MDKNEKLSSNAAVTPEQRQMIDNLSEATIRQIDQALLSNTTAEWCQTARLVLTTMIELDNGMGLPNSYFVERLQSLVKDGVLESKGDLTCTRSSEVRLK
jgi:hypothetical protein